MTKWAAGRRGCVDYATQGDSRIAPTVTFTSDGPPDGRLGPAAARPWLGTSPGATFSASTIGCKFTVRRV